MKALLFFMAGLLFGSLSMGQDISFADRTHSPNQGQNYHNNGLALVDYDGDGLEDIYVSVLLLGKNYLYKNLGNFIFQDYAVWAGLDYTGSSKTSAWGDVDNDGDPDLFIGNRDEPNRLYINQGDGTFLNQTSDLIGSPGAYNTNSVCMADFNNDGWLDIYVSNNNSPNLLYVNDGTGHFTDQGVAAGVNDVAPGMGAVAFDYDLDGDVDIYQVHDAKVANILYQNDGTGHFQNVAEAAGVHFPAFSMGAEAGDFNNDGWLDIYVTNLFDNFLYQNNGDGTFQSVGGCNDPGMGWGSVFADFNNDRRPDLYVSNDYTFSPYDNVLYVNTAAAGFVDVFGLPWDSPYAGYSTIASDLDDDGKMDIVIAHHGLPGVQFLQNTTNDNHHYVAFRLEGSVSNRDAIGSRLEVYTSLGVQYDEVIGNSSYASQNGQWIHFGLEDQTFIDSLIIKWPSGLKETISGLAADKKYRVKEGAGIQTATHNIVNKSATCGVTVDNSQLYIHLPETGEDGRITIFDMMGRNILEKILSPNVLSEINLPSMPSGIYHFMYASGKDSCMGSFFSDNK